MKLSQIRGGMDYISLLWYNPTAGGNLGGWSNQAYKTIPFNEIRVASNAAASWFNEGETQIRLPDGTYYFSTNYGSYNIHTNNISVWNLNHNNNVLTEGIGSLNEGYTKSGAQGCNTGLFVLDQAAVVEVRWYAHEGGIGYVPRVVNYGGLIEMACTCSFVKIR